MTNRVQEGHPWEEDCGLRATPIPVPQDQVRASNFRTTWAPHSLWRKEISRRELSGEGSRKKQGQRTLETLLEQSTWSGRAWPLLCRGVRFSGTGPHAAPGTTHDHTVLSREARDWKATKRQVRQRNSGGAPSVATVTFYQAPPLSS